MSYGKYVLKLLRVQHKVVPIINAALKTFTKKKKTSRSKNHIRASDRRHWILVKKQISLLNQSSNFPAALAALCSLSGRCLPVALHSSQIWD